MIHLGARPMNTVPDLCARLQEAIELEFATLPVYLYALYSLRPEHNPEARERLAHTVREEMLHMCLACNVLNAIGGNPDIAGRVPTYPGPLPHDIGSATSEPLVVHLLPFSRAAMAQGMHIEEPEDPLAGYQHERPSYTVGAFYQALDQALSRLPASAWRNRNQLGDQPFFAGELVCVDSYQRAHQALSRIVSQGAGSTLSPLDFQGELAHYYRFEEMYRDRVLECDADEAHGYRWGPALGVDWDAVFLAIEDPGVCDLSGDVLAQAAQDACDRAFTRTVDALQLAVTGQPGKLGNAVRHMYELRMAALAALATPLAHHPGQVAGPAFRYRPETVSRASEGEP